MAILADPAGAAFSLWQAGDVKGAELVNAPGSWNFSDLLTSDLEGAKDFYGTVFGWEYSPFFDEGDAGYWRRPGYGDFLESINPGTRERNAEMGAPDRFEDAVATVAPLGEGQDTPHWALTLATGDADATATRARELGATVVQEPIDLPWVRLTVLADPQGAVFTASQFKPPG
jgi:predicted enzyme related to lactoylglutathione lyase